MNFKIKSMTFWVMICCALLALGSGIFLGKQMQSKKKIDLLHFHGTYLENPRLVNSFSLQSTEKELFNNASLQNRWTILFFGFTNCAYLCPTTMAEIGKMYRLLENKGVKELPQVVMVSIDPHQDSQEKLKNYVKAFHPDFKGAYGDEEKVKAMTHEMGIAYAKIFDKQDGKKYDIQHSGALMLFNPQGELNAFFTTPHHADLLVKDYLQLIS